MSKHLNDCLRDIRQFYKRNGYSLGDEVSNALAGINFIADELEAKALELIRRGKER